MEQPDRDGPAVDFAGVGGAVLEPLLEQADHVGALGDVRPTTREIVVRETR
jgi:hypothetical protein